jgi:hypothetical protein
MTSIDRWFRRLALVSVVCLTVASFVAFGIRFWFVLKSGSYAATTGFEEFCLYNIWKAVHGFPLYEWPQRPPFLLTSYNFGFYHAYAGWIRLWHLDDAGLVLGTRLLTLMWTVLAFLSSLVLVRRLVTRREWSPNWAGALCGLFWFGSTFTPWQPVSARPDAAAVALALAALIIYVGALGRGTALPCLLASLLFFGAWSFKQSIVWIFAGVLLHSLLERRWLRLARLIAPFTILATIVISAGGDVYRYNVFIVPTIYRWFPAQSFSAITRVVLLNFFFWALAAVAVFRLIRPGLPNGNRPSEGERRLQIMAVILVPSVAFGLVQLALHGANANNILEGAALVAVLGSVMWLRTWAANETKLVGAGACLLLLMLPWPVLHAVLAARGIPEYEVHDVSLGNATKLNSAQLAQRRDFATWMQTLPKPIWLNDAMLQMPWFATDGKYPAYLFDFQFNADAMMKHVLEDGGFIGLIRQHRFAALLLRPGYDAWFIRAAQRAGYVEAPVPDRFSPLATEFGLMRPGPRLFVWPQGTSARP